MHSYPSKKSKVRHLVDHGIKAISLTWELSIKPYIYLRTSKLPEYDDLKSASISAETLTFFKRIVSQVPKRFQLKKRAKLVKNYLLNPDKNAKLPDFSLMSGEENSDDSVTIEENESDSSTPFPSAMIDIFYLIGDFFFKTSEADKGVVFYFIDISFNPFRRDCWISLALSLCHRIDSMINEMESETMGNDLTKLILTQAQMALQCFRKCIELCPNSTTVCIESANLGYNIFAFCGRQMSDENVGNLSMELFTKIDQAKPEFGDFSLKNYEKAAELFSDKLKEDGTKIDEDNTENDERWISYLMAGKIKEKQKRPLIESLELYLKAFDNLVTSGAKVPKKINFNSPPESTIELLEIYYRLHASILKQEIKGENFPPKDEILVQIQDLMKRFHDIALKAIDGLAPVNKSPPTISSQLIVEKTPGQTIVEKTEEELGPPPAKIAKKDNDEQEDKKDDDDDCIVVNNTDDKEAVKSETLWTSISQKCLRALELTVQRFPHHFKALHLLSQYYVRSEPNKNLKKAKKYLWGNDLRSTSASGNSGAANNNQLALFSDRKSNNLFNGIWRLPFNEADRPGNFSTHMGKSVNTLLELATVTNDYQLLLEVAIVLRKTPNSDQKFLYEKERQSFSKQACANFKKVLRKRADSTIPKASKEAQLSQLLEIKDMYLKLRKAFQGKDETIVGIMSDLYKSIGGNPNGSFEEINTYCNKALAHERSYQSSKLTNTQNPQEPFKPLFPNTFKPKPMPTFPTTSTTAAASKATPPSAASAKKHDPNTVKAALDYMNAANYYNELMASMMMASATSGTSTQDAYLNAYAAASYGSLMKNIPNALSVTKTDKKSNVAGSSSPKSGPLKSTAKTPTTSSATPSVSVSLTPSSKDKTTEKKAVPTQKLPTSVTVTKTNKAASPASSLASTKAPSKLAPFGQSGKSASALAIEKVYKKASSASTGSSAASILKPKSMPGLTLSKVPSPSTANVQRVMAGKKASMTLTPSSKAGSTSASALGLASGRLPNSISAAAVASANKLLMQERNAIKNRKPEKSTGSNPATPPSVSLTPSQPRKPSPAQSALAKLKTFRGTLPGSLKRAVPSKPSPSGSTPSSTAPKPKMTPPLQGPSSTKPAPPKVIKVTDDDDVICID